VKSPFPVLAGAAGVVLALGFAAGCGFECNIQGEREQFASCEALKERYDAEQSQVNPDNAVLDDLDVCGEVNDCEVQP
jgi:hypothetical protein